MEPATIDTDTNEALAERFASLPMVVQEAITSADVQAHLRTLASTHKLHVDQWQVLENDVMLTLLGFQEVQDLARELEKDLEVSAEVAGELALSISETVFKPIREEMEKNLDHPSVAGSTPSEEPVAPAPSAPAPIAPATPPPAAPTIKAVRGEIPASYHSSASHERKSIDGDPYREQLL